MSRGVYQRCASFSLAGTTAVALSPDGRMAAMLNGDGIARIVDIATQQVVAALAPAHDLVTRVRFSPSGDAVLTIAGGEHQATLWRARDWTLLWTTTLPGHTYEYMDGAAGAIAFSPDGRSVVVSPGTDLHLLDVATGALRASYASTALLDAAYAWGGRRIVVADALLTGHCLRGANGGKIVGLDPDTLAAVVTVTSWSGYADDNVRPEFRASPSDDLVLAPPSTNDTDRSMKAFRISDGSALPRWATNDLPRAFMPDGATMLVTADGELRLARVADGAILARAPAAVSTTSTVTISNDGSTVAVGGGGPDLLHVWNTGTSYAVGVCALAGDTPGAVALSNDGKVAAMVVGANIEVRRVDDGKLVATVPANGASLLSKMILSPTGRYLAGQFGDPTSTGALTVVSVKDNGAVATLARQQPGYPSSFVFSPDERSFYAVRGATGATMLQRVDLLEGATVLPTASRPIPDYTQVIGFSRGCPVLWNQLTGAYRSCDTCDEPPIPAGYAPNTAGAVVSPDGAFALACDPGGASVSLRRLPPDQRAVSVFAAPADDVHPTGIPFAVSNGGRRVLVGGYPNAPCYSGHLFAAEVRDGVTGDLLDELPPGPGSIADDMTTIAYGAQIWCAR